MKSWGVSLIKGVIGTTWRSSPSCCWKSRTCPKKSPSLHSWMASNLGDLDLSLDGVQELQRTHPSFFTRLRGSYRPAFISTCWQVRKKALRGTNSMWLRFNTASRLKSLPAELHLTGLRKVNKILVTTCESFCFFLSFSDMELSIPVERLLSPRLTRGFNAFG